REVRDAIPDATALATELAAERRAVSALATKPREAMAYYTALNERLFFLIGSIDSKTSNAELCRLSTAYLALLRAKEKMGLERAQLSNVFGVGGFAPDQFLLVASLKAEQDSYLQVFSSMVDPRTLALYRERMTEPVVAEVARMESMARSAATGNPSIEPTQWFAAMTGKIELLKSVENALAATILKRGDEVMLLAQRSMW